jgi:hypothetical protein
LQHEIHETHCRIQFIRPQRNESILEELKVDTQFRRRNVLSIDKNGYIMPAGCSLTTNLSEEEDLDER